MNEREQRPNLFPQNEQPIYDGGNAAAALAAELAHYALPGLLSDLTDFKQFTDWLPNDPRVMFQVTQGLIVHEMWYKRYGVRARAPQKRRKSSPSASDILAQASELREVGISFAVPRSPEERVIACCREFALLATAIFRAKGIPARARCGFALYLAAPGFYEDHWVCEYWNGTRWVAMDPQIDPFQQSALQSYANSEKVISEKGIDSDYREMLLSLDPLNVTTKHFINAGIAWKIYRGGLADPDKFGLSVDPDRFGLKTLYGAWFIRGQLLRDFAALNKIESAPFLVRVAFGQSWESWRLISANDDDLADEELRLLDTIADLCANPDGNLEQIANIFRNNHALHPVL